MQVPYGIPLTMRKKVHSTNVIERQADNLIWLYIPQFVNNARVVGQCQNYWEQESVLWPKHPYTIEQVLEKFNIPLTRAGDK